MAGAGSGEFHVYKASRRRENERLRVMDEEVERERADAAYSDKQAELRRLDEEKLARNRGKREKAKLRKMKAGGKGVDGEAMPGVKKGLGAAKIAIPRTRDGEGGRSAGLTRIVSCLQYILTPEGIEYLREYLHLPAEVSRSIHLPL